MAIGSLHDTLVFKIFILSSLFLVVTGRAYAAPWFTTYGAGVLSGNTDNDSIVTTQPSFSDADVFTSTLVQPGVARPILMSPDHTHYDFSYGGILSSGGYSVTKAGGTDADTNDAFAKEIGTLGDTLPDYQRFLDAATPAICNQDASLLTSCNLRPGIYKASLTDINSSLSALSSGIKYHVGAGNTSGLLVLVQEDPASSGTLNINNSIVSISASQRLVLITNGKINIASGVGTNPVIQAGYISQEADIQAMLITTFYDNDPNKPSVEVQSGSAKSVKIDGPIISKGKIRFRRDAGSAWPGVFVQFNPFYAVELAKLDASLNIFGSSSVRWSYE